MSHYMFKTAKRHDPIDTSWEEAQAWCNFVLFKPTWLPKELTEIFNKIRPETPEGEASHRVEFHSPERSISIKQFLYDWAPPAYDHPCLWRNAKISTSENTPLPKPYLIGNNYLWFGLDYRRKLAASINMLRTQIEITILKGSFEDQEIIRIVSSMEPVDNNAKDLILATSFAELMFSARYPAPASDVPTSYFKHTRNKAFQCYPRPFTAITSAASLLPGHCLISAVIKDYRLDSVFLFGQDPQHIHEAEYYFESLIEAGSYIRFLVTNKDSKNSIQYPPQLGDQECYYDVHQLKSGEELYHAWSKTNEHGVHTFVFKIKKEVINCIIKPAPWTTINWAKEVCQNLFTKFKIFEWSKEALNLTEINATSVLQTPWSSVVKINTRQGWVYLKQTPPDLFIEVDVIQKCRDLCKITDIPEVIAANKDLHCFLMKECGDVSLRTFFNGHINIDLLVQGLQIYRKMQEGTVPHVESFLQAGVPDWRLEKFPKLYQDLVSDEVFLKTHGLEAAQIEKLQNSLVNVSVLCQALSSYGIPECLNHSDFHENNMLFNNTTHKISIIDLGETAIDHPFFSLAAILKIPCNRYSISLGSPEYQTLFNACFQGWLGSDDDLQKAVEFTEKLLPIYLIFAHMRLVNATCPIALSNIPRMSNRVKEGFLWFIKNINNIAKI